MKLKVDHPAKIDRPTILKQSQSLNDKFLDNMDHRIHQMGDTVLLLPNELERAIEYVKEYYAKENKAPTRRTMPRWITLPIGRKEWVKWNVSTTNQLILLAGHYPSKIEGIWKGKHMLDKAKKLALYHYKIFGRSPTEKQLGKDIVNSIRRGIWAEWGIISYNPFL